MQTEAQHTETTDTRTMLRDSITRLLERHYSFGHRRRAHETAAGECPQAWALYAEQGLLALGLPEAHSGLDTTLADVALAAELLGGALTLEPYRPVMVAARLLARAGTPAQQADHLPPLIEGRLRLVLAHEERDGRLNAPLTTTATPAADGWRLTGRKAVVAGGDSADHFIVSAQLESAMALFLVPAAAVLRRAQRGFDWTGSADIDLDGVLVPAAARLAGGADALAHALDEATALACADAIGAMRAANTLVRTHTHGRRQFGRALDNFQVLQHRLVDMVIAEAFAAPLTATALNACEGTDARARARAVSAAKVKVGESARLVAQQGVQMHGGMGLVQEYPAAHFFARLGLFERNHGSADEHLERFAALADWPDPYV
jgi:alkylation response protein AidB-like acyl-CoA dehydrogenase